MIIKGSQRGHGAQLAVHLLNPTDNDHVTVHAIDGVLADDLTSAFLEIEAIAKGTKCQKPFFSVSVNPPADADFTDKQFSGAVHRIERINGLRGQPRAMVFHEKDGRRHLHVVWSRIDARTMTAKNLSHFKTKLMTISKELFLEHGFDLPDGFKEDGQASPDRVDLAEWQAAKRRGKNAVDQKRLIRQCWEHSDSRAGFEAALGEHGYKLAQGDRRSHVVVCHDGQVIAVARAVGIKTKEVRARLGDASELQGVDDAHARFAKDITARFGRMAREVRAGLQSERVKLDAQRAEQIARHRSERTALLEEQAQRRAETLAALQSQTRRGLAGFWDRVTGARAEIERAIVKTAADLKRLNADDLHKQRKRQLRERRALEQQRTKLRQEAFGLVDDLRHEHDDLITRMTGATPRSKPSLSDRFQDAHQTDPRQPFVAQETSGPVTDAEIRQDPIRVLERLSYFDETFSATDIHRALARVIGAPDTLAAAQEQVLASSKLLSVEAQGLPRYTTRDFRDAQQQCDASAARLAKGEAQAVSKHVLDSAIRNQDLELYKSCGARLSEEQRSAIMLMMRPKNLTMLVGRAGTGKSTILAAGRESWEQSGITVHGAALSGKAAAGLQEASGISSRTLASLEMSWANGNSPIKQGDVLVIDEAGMVGTRQMARVAQRMDEIGAKLVLVGDPDQLPPVEAGEPFRAMIDAQGAAWLTEVHRQQADWQKDATTLLATGSVQDAVEAYDRQDCVTRAQTGRFAVQALVDDYLADLASNPEASRLVLAHRRKDVHALNQNLREALKDRGQLTDGQLVQTDHGPRELASGERIVFTRNDGDLGVKNGMLASVDAASDGRVTVTLDDDPARKVTFNPDAFQSFDHGYAVTIHKSQGVTVDQAYVLASRSMDDALAYVALSRHRRDMQLYVSDTDRPKWSQPHRQSAQPTRQAGWHLEM